MRLLRLIGLLAVGLLAWAHLPLPKSWRDWAARVGGASFGDP